MQKSPTLLSLTMILLLVLPTFAGQSGRPTPAPIDDLAAEAGFASDVYVVIMLDSPISAYTGEMPGYPATRPGKGKKINPYSAHVRKYTGHLKATHERVLTAVGTSPNRKIYDYTYAFNGFAARLSAVQAVELARQPGVLSVQQDEMRFLTTDSSPAFLGLTAPAGPWSRGYDGEGIVVGIIDSGIWPEHPSFADDGSYAAPPQPIGACDFGNTAHNPLDVPFTCNNKLIGARQFMAAYRAAHGADPDEYDSARDDNGHGTHTASTAAGNAGVPASLYGIPRRTISGIAPRAYVVAYKACGNLGCFISDLAAAIDQAVADGVDVINYSIGGEASLTNADEIAFLFAADAGVFVATSAGNSGSDPGTIGSPAAAPWITSVAASTQSRFFTGKVVLGNDSAYTGAAITPGVAPAPLIDATLAGGELCIPGTLDSGVVNGTIVLCRRGAVGRAAKSLAVSLAGGVGMILYNTSDDDNLFTDTHWVPSVHLDHTPGLAIKNYIATATDPTAEIIAEPLDEWSSAPSMTIFSSRGPNLVAPDIIKPDITAPGIQILAGNSPTPDPDVFPGELFQAIAGTSMSSPHVAGIGALLKQAHPNWSPAMIKSAIMTTASRDVRDNDRVSPADPFDMGAGHVNPGGRWNKGSIAQPGLVYDTGFLNYLGFLCDAAPETFSDPAATCASLEALGISTDAGNLNLPSIGIADLPGSRTVVRTVTSVTREDGWRIYKASVEPPPGFDVSVSPSSLWLRRGQTATYAVTFTNVSAPIGEWRFGSLTWRDRLGKYNVYSPIAVKASLSNATAEVSGSEATASRQHPSAVSHLDDVGLVMR